MILQAIRIGDIGIGRDSNVEHPKIQGAMFFNDAMIEAQEALARATADVVLLEDRLGLLLEAIEVGHSMRELADLDLRIFPDRCLSSLARAALDARRVSPNRNTAAILPSTLI